MHLLWNLKWECSNLVNLLISMFLLFCFFLVAQTNMNCISDIHVFHVFCNSYYCLNRALRPVTHAYTCSYWGCCETTWSHFGDLFQSRALQELMKNIFCELGLGTEGSTGGEAGGRMLSALLCGALDSWDCEERKDLRAETRAGAWDSLEILCT